MEAENSRILVGIDEAGLGPLLGPLVIGCSVMRLPADFSGTAVEAAWQLWTLLKRGISDDPKQQGAKLVVCDSKKLHQSAKGVGRLEGSVLPLMCASAEPKLPANFEELWKRFSLAPLSALDAYPWYQSRSLTLPHQASSAKCGIRAQQAERTFSEVGAKLLSVRVFPVLAGELNRLLGIHRNKSDAHIASIAGLLKGIWAKYPKVEVLCDRLGGKQRYAPALEVMLEPAKVQVIREEPEQSSYRLTRTNAKGETESMTLSFLVSGDNKAFPIALASMAAKYSRELCMELFNAWFIERMPDLKPTKGYYQDAGRFLRDTEKLRESLRVPVELLIRKK